MNKIILTFMFVGIVMYASCSNNDYYNTGDVISLHRHTVGNGVAIVFLGDGFNREDCRKGGVYEDNCRKMAALFLSMPVVRDFKDYFDISARVDVSKDRGVRNCVENLDKCPDNAYGSGRPDLYWDKIYSNAKLTAGKDDCSPIFMGNGMIGGHVIGGVAVYSADEPNKVYWMIHEFVGHVVGRMPDMYIENGENHVNDETKATIDRQHLVGELSMLDWRSHPDSVFWKDFIGRKGYEKVGVYPSGWYGIVFGDLFTCEPHNSTVMYGSRAAYFTVMERYQLWRQIQTRAGFPTTVEKFIEYDAVNLKETDWSWEQYKSLDWTDNRIWNWQDDK